MGYFKIKIAVTFEGRKTLQRDQCSANLWHLNFCTALVPLQSFSSFKSYSDFNLKIAQKWEILRENNVIFQFSKNWNIYLSMSCLSFFHLFSDFLLKNRAKFDTFSLIFEFQPPLLIRFSDTEILIVPCLFQLVGFNTPNGSNGLNWGLGLPFTLINAKAKT